MSLTSLSCPVGRGRVSEGEWSLWGGKCGGEGSFGGGARPENVTTLKQKKQYGEITLSDLELRCCLLESILGMMN